MCALFFFSKNACDFVQAGGPTAKTRAIYFFDEPIVKGHSSFDPYTYDFFSL